MFFIFPIGGFGLLVLLVYVLVQASRVRRATSQEMARLTRDAWQRRQQAMAYEQWRRYMTETVAADIQRAIATRGHYPPG